MRKEARIVLVGCGLAVAGLLMTGNALASPSECGSGPCARGGQAAMQLAQTGAGDSQPARVAAQPRTEQAYSLPPDKLAKARVLNRIRLTLDILGSLWGMAVLWIMLASRAAARLELWAQRTGSRRWVQGVAFFAAFVAITALANLPLDLAGHIASRHYGISVQGWGDWWGDQGKSLGVSLVIGVPVLLLFHWMVRVSPRRYWLWTWLVSIPLTVASVFLAPLVLDPLFDKFEPLTATHPKLVQELERVVARTGTEIPPQRMFLMKASAKSNGVNAYVTGIGSSKRFVMWDTTTDRMPDDEILFIFGHESGHYVLHHIAKGLAATVVGMFFLFWMCARMGEGLVRRFGSRWQVETVASRAGFLALLLALSIAGFVLTPVSTGVSRHMEHQADVYGQEAIHGLVADPQKTAVSSFNHLGESWLEDPDPSRFVEFWLYNHPSVKNRANFAAHYDPWANGGRGKYFLQ
jgi:Zn-dependent protease with chaperone function